jgi:hypothetical protein
MRLFHVCLISTAIFAATAAHSPAAPHSRRGRLHQMQPRWQGDAYGSRNPVPLLVGTSGWGLIPPL